MSTHEATQVRCPKCNRLLFKLEGGAAQVEIMCPRCKQLTSVTVGNQQRPDLLGQVQQALKPAP